MKHHAQQMGLFAAEEFKNDSADQPWKKSETSKMLDLYFAGGADATPARIAQKLGRNPKAVKRRIEQFRNNERDRALNYEPFKRLSRCGMRWTENEKEFVRCYRKKGISMKVLAKVLQRQLKEIGPTREEGERLNDVKRVGTGVDLILAYRFLYYCKGISILPDAAYDALEQEEMEFGAGAEVLKGKVGSDNADDYPPHIRALASYLVFKYAGRK